MKLIKFNSKPRSDASSVTRLTLDEVRQQAMMEGTVEIGGILGQETCQIKLSRVGEHYICVRSRGYPTAVDNLLACIEQAQKIRGAL